MIKIANEWEQTYFSGMKPKKDNVKGEIPTRPTYTERVIDERLQRWEDEVWDKGGEQLDLPGIAKDSLVVMPEVSQYRLPSPDQFPKLTIDTISSLLVNKQGKFSKSDALKTYNRFKKAYQRYYNIYLQINPFLVFADQDQQILNNLRNLPLKKFLYTMGEFLVDAIIGIRAEEFINFPIYFDLFIQRNKQIDPADLVITTEQLENAANNFEQIEEIKKIEYRWHRQITDWMNQTKNRLFIKNINEEIEARIKNSICAYYPTLRSVYLRSVSDIAYTKIPSIIMGILDREMAVISTSINARYAQLIFDVTNVKIQKLKTKIHNITDQVSDIDRAYEEACEITFKYFDLKKLERLYNSGIFSKDKSRMDTREEFRAGVLKRLKYLFPLLPRQYGSHVINDIEIYRFKSSELADKYLDEIVDKQSDKNVELAIAEDMGLHVANTAQDETSSLRLATQEAGDFSPAVIINKVVEKARGHKLPEDPFRVSVKLLMRQGRYNDAIALMRSFDATHIVLFNLLQRQGKLFSDQIINLLDLDSGLYRKLTALIRNYSDQIRKDPSILVEGLRSIDTLAVDIRNISDLLSIIHNNANNIKADTLRKLLGHRNVVFMTSRNIAQKFNESIVKVLGQGGVKVFKRKYTKVIKVATDRQMIRPNFAQRFDVVAKLFLKNEEINPSSSQFQEIKDIILEVSSDIDLILGFDTWIEHYNIARPKDANLFKLDMAFSSNLRFRVLRDLDSYHFKVGLDTDCCQTPGGAGESAMVDSFINPLAGVLVLEELDRGKWTAVAQSYFHWVPEDRGYILDNIEVASGHKGQKFKVFTGAGNVDLTIEQLYAYWAQRKKHELQLPTESGNKGYILAGTGYSDIDTSVYGKVTLDKDPRYFATDHAYSDWSASQSMDLTSLEVSTTQSMSTMAIYNNIYKLAVEFQDNLKEYLQKNPDQYQHMEKIEEESFQKYKNIYDFDQDSEDMQDDLGQPGAMGVGVTDNVGNMAGYVYGYNMTMDEMPDIDLGMSNHDLAQKYGIHFYTTVPEGFAKHFYNLINKGKVFYIANLALPQYKIKLAKMLKDLLEKLRRSGYQYATFDGLSDTMKLFLNEDREPKASRMDMFGVQLIAMIPDEGGWEHAQAVLKI